MSKISFTGLSLVAAIPGALLSYFLIMAMVGHFSDMVGMMRMVVVLILLMSALMTVMPVGIMLFVKEDKPARSTSTDVEATEPEEIAEAGDEFLEADEEPEPEPKGKKKKKKKKK